MSLKIINKKNKTEQLLPFLSINRSLKGFHLNIFMNVLISVPENFHPMLHKYSVQGFRVIALAYRSLETKVNWHQVQRISRYGKITAYCNYFLIWVEHNYLSWDPFPSRKFPSFFPLVFKSFSHFIILKCEKLYEIKKKVQK